MGCLNTRGMRDTDFLFCFHFHSVLISVEQGSESLCFTLHLLDKTMTLNTAEIHELYAHYGALVYRRCRTLLGNEQEAQELMQEAFLRLVVHAEVLRGEASPLTWLYRVSTNLCLNRMRDTRARKLKLDLEKSERSPGLGQGGGADPELRQLLMRLLEKADEETRACVLYYYLDDLTLEEVAELVSLSVPTVRKRLQQFQGMARRTVGLEPATSKALLLLSGGSGMAALLERLLMHSS